MLGFGGMILSLSASRVSRRATANDLRPKIYRTPTPVTRHPLRGCDRRDSPLQSAFQRKVKLMLKQLSRLEKTRNFLILGFVGLMAVSLVLFYKPGGSGSALEPTRNTEAVAKVNGEEITVADIAQLKEN